MIGYISLWTFSVNQLRCSAEQTVSTVYNGPFSLFISANKSFESHFFSSTIPLVFSSPQLQTWFTSSLELQYSKSFYQYVTVTQWVAPKWYSFLLKRYKLIVKQTACFLFWEEIHNLWQFPFGEGESKRLCWWLVITYTFVEKGQTEQKLLLNKKLIFIAEYINCMFLCTSIVWRIC